LSTTLDNAFPTEHQLRAAAHVLSILGDSPVVDSDLKASYSTAATGLLLSSRDLEQAEGWLLSRHWLAHHPPYVVLTAKAQNLPRDADIVVQELFRELVFDTRPLWLRMAVSTGRIREELLPERVLETLRHLFPADDQREAILIAAAFKVDTERLKKMGDVGEKAVMAQCKAFLKHHGRPDLAELVRRVSLISDQLGYDIVAPNIAGIEQHLEVKCFAGRHPNFYLTRNEYEVGVRSRNWELVLCRMRNDEEADIMGWTTLEPIQDWIPEDCDPSVTWQSIRVRLNSSEVFPGLPLGRVASLSRIQQIVDVDHHLRAMF
jgi:hypothetical protein